MTSLDDIWLALGCTRWDLSRWARSPHSTHAAVVRHKRAVIEAAQRLFSLSDADAEYLANCAGLTLEAQCPVLPELLRHSSASARKELIRWVVSERMLEYYAAGQRRPTKEVLLAMAMILDQDADTLLRHYGFCLSASLPRDAIVRHRLRHSGVQGVSLLLQLNEELDALSLPLLMAQSGGINF